MTIAVKYLSTAEWTDFVNQHPLSTYYHTPQWYTIWENYMGYTPHAVMFTVNGKQVFFPYATTRFRRGLFKKITSSPAGVYGGFLSNDDVTEQELDALINRVAKMGQELYISDYNNHIGKRKTTTQIINMSKGIEHVRANYASAHQRKINKTIEEGVAVRIAITDQDWDNYYTIYRQMLNNWDNPTMKYSTELFNEIKRQTNIKLWLTEKEGEIMGGAICLYHNNHVAYWHGASNDKAKNVNANYLLFDTILEDACKQAYNVFDMMPSAGLKGVEEFKNNFGAVQKEVSLIVRSSKILKIFGHA